MQTVGVYAATLVKLHNGMHDLTSFEAAKSKLNSHLDVFVYAHNYITVTAPPTTEEHIAWHTIVPFDVAYLLHDVPSIRQSSLASFIAEFESAAQVVLTLPISECTLENRYLYFLIANQDTIHDALEESMQLRHLALTAEFSSFSGLVRCLCTDAIAHGLAVTGFDCRVLALVCPLPRLLVVNTWLYRSTCWQCACSSPTSCSSLCPLQSRYELLALGFQLEYVCV